MKKTLAAVSILLALGSAGSLAQDDSSERAWLGVTLGRPAAQAEAPGATAGEAALPSEGVLITGVAKESPADRAGLRAGDIVLSIEGAEVGSPQALARTIGSFDIGSWISLSIVRREDERIVSARLGPRPERIAGLEIKRGWAGIVPVDVPAQLQEYWAGEGMTGVLIGAVLPTGPAELAGLRPGDLIVTVDGRPVGTASDLVRSIASGGIGNETLLEVSRQGTWLEVELTIEEEPPREVLAELEEAGSIERTGR